MLFEAYFTLSLTNVTYVLPTFLLGLSLYLYVSEVVRKSFVPNLSAMYT